MLPTVADVTGIRYLQLQVSQGRVHQHVGDHMMPQGKSSGQHGGVHRLKDRKSTFREGEGQATGSPSPSHLPQSQDLWRNVLRFQVQTSFLL